MGRLIDADVLREEVCSWGMNDYEPSDFTDAIDDAPTVEAIPKDQYEARLKADMMAMLEEIQMEVMELPVHVVSNIGSIIHMEIAPSAEDVYELIQQKIDKLKEK